MARPSAVVETSRARARTRSTWMMAVALTMVATVTGCTHDCTDIGDESQLTFTFASLAKSGERLKVRACVGDTCRSVSYPSEQTPHPEVTVGGDAMSDGAMKAVSLRIVDRSGHVVFDGSTSVTPVKREVNGEGCPPQTWQGRVSATDGGDLVVESLPA